MNGFRGFQLGRKIVKVFRWINRPRRKPGRCRVRGSGSGSAMSKLLSFVGHLQRGAKKLGLPISDPGYIQLGQPNPVGVPKGHLAVYVGESDDETKRVLVPVIYFNHPLFVGLLREAERVYGFDHSGGITIPCRISEFEKVKMRIDAWEHCRKRKHRLHW